MKILLVLSALLCFASCKPLISDGTDESSDTEHANALGIIGQLVNGLTAPTRDDDRADCNTLTYAACNTNQQKVKDFSSCTKSVPSGFLTVFGKSILSYAACSPIFPPSVTGTTETRTYDDHYYTTSSGRSNLLYTAPESYVIDNKTVSLTSIDLQDYDGTERSGGAVVTYNLTTRTLVINGIHRRTISGGAFGLWHTLYTSSAINIDASTPTRVLAGTVILANNRGRYTVTYTFTALTYSDGCNFPNGGTINVTVADASSTLSSYSLTFTPTCGSVTKTVGSTTETLTLEGGI